MISALTTRRSAVAASNFRRGRAWPREPDCITEHVTEGSAASVRAWFAETRPDPSSSHYMVCVDGTIDAFVDEDDTAYHAGKLVSPTSPLVISRHANGGYTPNSYAIGIEHEGDGRHELTAPQRAASVALHVDIYRRRGVLLDRVHIFGHREVKASKSCPGAISVDRLVADVRAAAGETAPPPLPQPTPPTPSLDAPPAVVYSPKLGWLVPVTVTSDEQWTFATVDEVRAAIKSRRVPATMEAGTPLSHMPRNR